METELNDKQILFCKYYLSKEFFGNGVDAYCAAYNLDRSDKRDYENAKQGASRLLTNANILLKINEELEDAGLNDNFVDKQLLFVITQNADLASKIGGIREYNKLRQRITDKLKTDNTFRIIDDTGQIDKIISSTSGAAENTQRSEEV